MKLAMKKRPMLAAGMAAVVGALALAVVNLGRAGDVGRPSDAPPGRLAISGCLVSVVEEAEVPAQEAGVLTELLVREGSRVHKGDLLGRVSDRAAQLQKQLADTQYRSAKEKSENDINVRYAAAAAKVAEATYLAAVDANQRVLNAIAFTEVRRLELDSNRAKLQIEQAQMEQKVLAHDRDGKASELEAADDGVRRRQVVAPIDGVVVELRRHIGEWLSPGQTVLRVVRVDRLRVEGFVNASKFEPPEIADRPVRVDVDLARGRRSFKGRVVFVSPLVQAGGEYRIWAEVENVQENGAWVLQPGQTATMTVE